MRFLLDTHIFLWRLLDPRRLSRAQTAALGDGGNQLLLSPISVWETLVLARRGRVDLLPDPERFVRDSLAESPVRQAPFTFEIAIASERLDGFESQDPADRFLVATTVVEDLTLITSDERILNYEEVRTLC